MRLDNFTKNNLIMFFANGLGSFFNLLYQLVMLRLVSKNTFASLNSLLSLLVILSVPCLAFTAMVTKHVSSHNARRKLGQLKGIWQKLSVHAFLFSSIVLAAIILFRRNIAGFLQLDSLNSVIILGGIFFFSGIVPLVNGGLQGLERFKWLAAIGAASGFLKLLLSAGLVKNAAHPLEGALCGFLLSIFISILFSIWPLRFLWFGQSGEKTEIKQLYIHSLPILAVSLCFALLTNIDMVLVKHFFLTDAQDYSIAQMVGKIILSISGMIYVVMFSRASGLHAVRESSKGILRRSLFFTFVLSFLAVIIYNLFPGFIFGILAGSVNPQVIALGRFFSLSMLFYALNNVLFYYQLSIERYGFIKPLILMVSAQIAALWLFHQTTLAVASIMLVSSLAIFILNLRSALEAAA